MVKKQSNDQTNLVIVAIVAIVAIVVLVILVMNNNTTASSSNLGGKAYGDAEAYEEVCVLEGGIDDDCDGIVDEGFSLYKKKAQKMYVKHNPKITE